MKSLLVFLLLAGSRCFAAPPPEIAPLAASYQADTAAVDSDRTAAIARAARIYEMALDDAEKTATAKGEVKPLAAIATERDAVKAGTPRPAPPADFPKELLPVQKTYLAGVAKAEAEATPRRQRAVADYLRALAALQARSAGNASLLQEIAAEKESVVRGIPVEALDITKRLIGTTWNWSGDKETVIFQDHGKGRWSVGGGKDISWKIADAAARKIEGVNGKGNPFQLVLEPSMEAGQLTEKGGHARRIELRPPKQK